MVASKGKGHGLRGKSKVHGKKGGAKEHNPSGGHGTKKLMKRGKKH